MLINIHKVYAPFLRHFRKKRMRKFIDTMGVTAKTRILDVGGSPDIWLGLQSTIGLPFVPDVTLLNVNESHSSIFKEIVADARALPFPDKAFDIVFSNSMIEHLGEWDSQVKAALEMARVGKSIWVQTPNYWFPIEPHLLTPFVHWFPSELRRRVLPYTVWGIITQFDRAFCDEFHKELRLLTPREMAALFPDAELLRERTLGMSKSLIAARR